MIKKLLLSFVWLLLILMIPGCQSGFKVTDQDLYSNAQKLSKDFLMIDTHIDLPIWLYGKWFDVSKLSEKGEFDYARAVEGGLDLAFMAIYTSPDLEGTGKSKMVADSLVSVVYKMQSEWPDKFKLVRSTSDVLENTNKNIVLLAMGMENGSPIENNLENVKYFYDKGVRYITLSHYKWNHISDSANDPERKWNGLSSFGEDVVKEMNRLGMMIDVSHISDSAFYDVISLSKAPVIASHSSCRYFVPGFERNMNDEMIKTLAEHGGVIQINFASMFLDKEIYDQYDSLEKGEAEVQKYFKDNNIDPRSSEGKEYTKKFLNEHPVDKATVRTVADHIDHVVKLTGADYVGIGSDYNGVGDSLPVGLEDVSKMPNLVYELLSRGYSENDIKKILGGNIMRVWKKVEEISRDFR